MEMSTVSETAERENAAAGLAMLHSMNDLEQHAQSNPEQHLDPEAHALPGAEPSEGAGPSASGTLGLWPPSRVLTARVKPLKTPRQHDSLVINLLDCRGTDGKDWPVLPVGPSLEHRAPGKPPPFIVRCQKSELLPLAGLRGEELEACDEEVYMTVNNLLEVLGRSRSTNWRQGVRHDDSSGQKLNPCLWIEGGECVEAYMARIPPPQEPPPQLPMGPPRLRPARRRHVPHGGLQCEDGDNFDGAAAGSRGPFEAPASPSLSGAGGTFAGAEPDAQHPHNQHGPSRPKRAAAGAKRYAEEIEQEEGRKHRKMHGSKGTSALSTSGSSTDSQEEGLPDPVSSSGAGFGDEGMVGTTLVEQKRAELIKRLGEQGVAPGQAAHLVTRYVRTISPPTSEGGHWHFHLHDGAPPAPSLNKATSRLILIQQQQQEGGMQGQVEEDVDVWMQQQGLADPPGTSFQQEGPKAEPPQAAPPGRGPRRAGRSNSRPTHQSRSAAQTSAVPIPPPPQPPPTAARGAAPAPPGRAAASVQQQQQQQHAFEHWSVDDTAQWLLEQGCTAAVDLFIRHNVNGRALAALARIGRSSDGLYRVIREEFPQLGLGDRSILTDAIMRLVDS